MQSQAAPFQLAGRLARSSSPALRRLLRQSHDPEVISLAGGFPPPETFPVEALRAAVDRTLASRPESALQYSVAEGREELRERIAEQASARLARAVSPAQVIVTNGAQQATTLVAAALLEDDADAAFENPGYVGALQAVRLFARRVLPVPVDRDGGRVDVLADLAESGAVQVLEDDAYGTLSFSGEGPVPVAARSARVLFVGTFSKVLFPGFRLGYVIVPAGLAEWLAQVKQAMDLHTSTWAQTVMCQLLSDPRLLQRQTRRAVALYRSRSAGLAAALRERFGAALRFELPMGGMFIWARLGDPGVDTERLLPVAVEQGVTFVPGAAFFCGRAEPHALRLSFVTVEPDEARVAARRLHDAYLLHLADRPGRAATLARVDAVPAGAGAIHRALAIRSPSAAVFLDRDGTLIEEVPYLHEPDQVALLPGVAEGLARLAAAGYALVLVTNQAGVARGLYDEAAVGRVHRRLRELLAGAGVKLDGAYYCPHHPDGVVAAYARACRSRKPGPGMLERAAEQLDLDLAASYLIGNHPTDVGAAIAARATPLFVATGAAAGRPLPGLPSFADLQAAAAAVLEGSRRTTQA